MKVNLQDCVSILLIEAGIFIPERPNGKKNSNRSIVSILLIEAGIFIHEPMSGLSKIHHNVSILLIEAGIFIR